MCDIHKKELEIICITDRIKLCLHCALFGKHKDHKFKTIAEAENEIDLKKQEFSSFKTKKEALDQRLSSQEFKDSIVKKIGEQKDRLVTDIKKKFAHLYENIRMAEKKAFEDVVKNFKTVYLRITSLIK
jgi:predicted nuclease with TOPRIM domain